MSRCPAAAGGRHGIQESRPSSSSGNKTGQRARCRSIDKLKSSVTQRWGGWVRGRKGGRVGCVWGGTGGGYTRSPGLSCTPVTSRLLSQLPGSAMLTGRGRHQNARTPPAPHPPTQPPLPLFSGGGGAGLPPAPPLPSSAAKRKLLLLLLVPPMLK